MAISVYFTPISFWVHWLFSNWFRIVLGVVPWLMASSRYIWYGWYYMASVIHMLYGIFFAFKLRKLFSICDFSRAKDSAKVLNIIICNFYNYRFHQKTIHSKFPPEWSHFKRERSRISVWTAKANGGFQKRGWRKCHKHRGCVRDFSHVDDCFHVSTSANKRIWTNLSMLFRKNKNWPAVSKTYTWV